ncbi:hypothetical protein IW140_003318 [Coemansia sp. RSA 1813]|nr:hypothetical protein EV178_001814 [Coemansia sp. RSA 1646]KAJ1770569.1 hypothetical protein LPJ74_003096 [Coemansia sp. RSA 1843]KAJ2092989.1 hypothetical protein IW138_000703 [Coemansia sp. RSA 986]KAJ2211191.1 hypothetical protein EV179_005691 [Coemansia sp. RSA 487]KAJ2569098.1 hypothetical protein IW140_003318 [Coemansia sp. RSA 1813]
MSNANISSDDLLHITLVKYESGLGVPGIMPPKLSSTVEITKQPEQNAKVVKTEFTDNKPSNTHQGEIAASGFSTVLAMVDQLKTLPVRQTPGGPDVFGANTVVQVRQGRNVVWGYNPGAGCAVVEDEPSDELHASITDEHKASFVDIVGKIVATSNDALI